MTVLFWDIDGTLLTTGKAGVPAWEEAVREVVGHDFQLSKFRIAGLTDFQIAVRTFELLGVDVERGRDPPNGEALRGAASGSAAAQAGTRASERPGDSRTARAPDDVRSYLLTGNTRGGARAKLTHYDLFKYFPDGAFAEDASERSVIAARALDLARRAGPVIDRAVFVVGDTPHDIHCANAIGARTVAVATGGYSLDELESHRPWRAFAELPPADEFIRLIDEARAESGRRHSVRA